jgi:predicted dienelactone hydrolase
MARFAGLPWFVLNHLVHVETDVVDFSDRPAKMAGPGEGSHLRSTKLPLVLFSHGLGGICDIYLSVIQDLASHVRLCSTSHVLLCVARLFPPSALHVSHPLHAHVVSFCTPRHWFHLRFQGLIVAAIEHADESAALTTDENGGFVRYKPLTPMEKKDFGMQFVRRSGQVCVWYFCEVWRGCVCC